jgi:hypothetical protein
MNMFNYYSQLIGYKITAFHFEIDEFGSDPFPVFTIQNADGHLVDITLSSDEEGNGGGFAFIEGHGADRGYTNGR